MGLEEGVSICQRDGDHLIHLIILNNEARFFT
jgi:hypothetical protein